MNNDETDLSFVQNVEFEREAEKQNKTKQKLIASEGVHDDSTHKLPSARQTYEWTFQVTTLTCELA